MSATILLTEDDVTLRTGLIELLTREGYHVLPAACVREAREMLRDTVDLIILDVSLPDGNGIELCRSWRAAGIALPILFLTAKDEELDIVQGLDAGGNDYVTKPFRIQELLSRIRALLRRGQPTAVKRTGIEIDTERMQVRMDGEPLILTLTEYRLLTMLVQHSGVVTRNLLLEALWDDGAKFVDDNTLSVHISRLRDKVGAKHIKTIRGVGYQWQD